MIFRRRAISAGVLRPDDTASTISFFCSAEIFGFRPGTRPWARFKEAGARALADHFALEFGKGAGICISMRPAGPDVSIDSVNDRNFASAELIRSRMVRRSLSEWAVFFHRLGEIRDRTFENNDTRLQTSTSLVAAITLWNTVYLGRAVDQLRSQGEVIDDTLLGHIASLGWEHITFNGDYVWPTEPLQQSFRPLRNPRSAFLDPA